MSSAGSKRTAAAATSGPDVDDLVEGLAQQRARLENNGVDNGNDDDGWVSAGSEDDEEALAALRALKDTVLTAPPASSTQQVSPAPEPAAPAASNSMALMVVDAEADEALQAAASKRVTKAAAKQQAAIKQLRPVDHSKIEYAPFRKVFYIPPSGEAAMTAAELKAACKELDGAKIKGRDLPAPMKSWDGIGLSDRSFEYLREAGFHAPYAVQSLAIPPLMSGRDLLITAKTGSGKTLAYLLPLIRHVENQPRCGNGEGPIGLVVVPTVELAQQIYQTAIPLCKTSGLRLAAGIGGTNLGVNIPTVKRGCDVMVATPNRLHDLLLSNNESVMNLRRVTFIVVDEADRMLDDGFRPYVDLLMRNIRPDRQVAFISATMPPQLREVAAAYLDDPVAIVVGGRPSPSSNVRQSVEFFDVMAYNAEGQTTILDDPRFQRLLEILGDEIPAMPSARCVLIFVQRKEDCDTLYWGLRQTGYNGLIGTLYSGMEPAERDLAIKRFAPSERPILIAAGLAERGLDVFDLDLVINYAMPDHYEAYIQRIGRTGRAGRKGRAISFFTRKQDDWIANELALGLEESGNEVPEELNQIAQVYRAQHKNATSANMRRGYQRAHTYEPGSKEDRKRWRKSARDMGLGAYLSSESDSGDDSEVDSDADVVEKRSDPSIFRTTDAGESRAVALYNGGGGALTLSTTQESGLQDALAFARLTTEASLNPSAAAATFQTELEINDMAKPVRLVLSSRKFHAEVEERCGSKIALLGKFFDPRLRFKIPDGERKMYLEIRGGSRDVVVRTLRALEERRKEIESKASLRGSAIGGAVL